MNFIPVSQWSDYYKWPTEPGFRYLIFNAKDNGFKEMEAILRVKGRVLIDVDRFFEWVKEKNREASANGSSKLK